MSQGMDTTEDWGRSQHRMSRHITVGGPDAYVETLDRTRVGRPEDRRKRHDICRVEITWAWDGVELELPEEPTLCKLITARHGRPDGGYLFPDQLLRTPEWLASIITRSMPRL